jgi:predicted TIM-barrel fold metal-dependent hydrolase
MVDFKFFDADNHYYEAEDAFTRYPSERMARERFVRWLTETDGKRRRLFFGTREANIVGNPTFHRVIKPGAYHEVLKGLEEGDHSGDARVGGRTSAEVLGLAPINPAFRSREARLATMDEQGVEKVVLFPTLGVTVEGLMADDAGMLHDCFHAFNGWLDDDWGFAYQDRIFAAPYVSLRDVDRAVAELEWVLDRGARVITMRPGPAYGRSPAHPHFDPFWARVNEAGVLVTYHVYDGPSAYSDIFRQWWAAPPEPLSPEVSVLDRALFGTDTQIMDTLSALILHNLFGRFPNVRIGSMELGSYWVPLLLHRLDHAGHLVDRRSVTTFGGTLEGRPSEIFLQHVWVSPFPEEDVPALADLIGIDHVLMGSDFPHGEGTPRPVDYLQALKGLDPASIKRIMRDNALELICEGSVA